MHVCIRIVTFKNTIYRYNNERSTNNRIEMFSAKKCYKYLIRRKSARYKLKQRGKLKQLNTKNPKEFCNMLSPKEKAHQVKVAPDDYFSYFQDLCSRTEKDECHCARNSRNGPNRDRLPRARRTNIQQRDAVKTLRNENRAAMTTLSTRCSVQMCRPLNQC